MGYDTVVWYYTAYDSNGGPVAPVKTFNLWSLKPTPDPLARSTLQVYQLDQEVNTPAAILAYGCQVVLSNGTAVQPMFKPPK